MTLVTMHGLNGDPKYGPRAFPLFFFYFYAGRAQSQFNDGLELFLDEAICFVTLNLRRNSHYVYIPDQLSVTHDCNRVLFRRRRKVNQHIHPALNSLFWIHLSNDPCEILSRAP